MSAVLSPECLLFIEDLNGKLIFLLHHGWSWLVDYE